MGNITGIFTQVGDAFGMSHSLVGLLVALFTCTMIGFLAWRLTGSIAAYGMATGVGMLVAALLGFIPLWIALLTIIPAVLMMALKMYRIADDVVANAKPFNFGAIQTENKLPDSRNESEGIFKASEQFTEYHNNLDALLGITTKNRAKDWGDAGGLWLTKKKELWIDPAYDWYIVDKVSDKDVFKVVGLPKKNSYAKDRVYLLGRYEDNPFLTALPIEYKDKSMAECLEKAKENETNGIAFGLMMTTIASAMMPSLVGSVLNGVDTKGVRT